MNKGFGHSTDHSQTVFHFLPRSEFSKWSVVLDQIPRHTCKREPFAVLCAEGFVPRIGEAKVMEIANVPN